MRKKDKLKKDAVQSAAAALANLSRKDSEDVSRSTAAGLLKKQVRSARARGATWQEISEILKASGVDISTKTLARALDEDQKARAEKVDKKGTKKVATHVKAAPAVAPPGAGAVPPPVTAGGFDIKADRGADL